MEAAGRLAAEVLEKAGRLVKVRPLVNSPRSDISALCFPLRLSPFALCGTNRGGPQPSPGLSRTVSLSSIQPTRPIRSPHPLEKAGMTTEEIDIAVHNWIIEAGAYPSPLQYGVRRRHTSFHSSRSGGRGTGVPRSAVS